MPLPGSKTFLLVEPPTAFLRLVGRAAAEVAPGFKTLIHRLQDDGIEQYCLDLSECLLMDSTFSGVLAAFTAELGAPTEHRCARITLVNPNKRVIDLLDNLGVLPLVNILTGDGHIHRPGDTQEVASAAPSKAEVTECCLEAHRYLVTLSEANRARFGEPLRLMEEQAAGGL
jgi:anti-sigma B factor antagonist